VQAFIRISDKQIRIRADVTEPDIVVVLDPGLLKIVKVTAGLKKNGLVVVNAKSMDVVPADIRDNYRVAVIDANLIAKEVLGAPIVNTTMLGALIKASGVIKLESISEPLKHRFGKLAEKNLNAMKRAYEETQVKEMVINA
jgi:pyruvate ferredoxin oxidoreductase gamma subunit